MSLSVNAPRAGMARTATFRLTPAVEAGALVVITLCGLWVRLHGLTSYGIWFDESYHIALVQMPDLPGMLDAVLSNPPSDPLYVLLLRGWVGMFGHGDAAVRTLSVGFSTATVPAAYLLGRYSVGRVVGLLAALFFALSPYGVELGQEAALYSLAALTTTLALVAGLRWLRLGRGGALYAMLGVVAIYSHYVAAVIIVLFALLAMPVASASANVRRKSWLLANGLIVLAWVPWLAAVVVHWLGAAVPRASLIHHATVGDLYEALVQFTVGTSALRVGPELLRAFSLLLGIALFALGVWRGNRSVRVLAALPALIIVGPSIVSYVTGWWLFVPHFVLFLFPALAVVLACGVLSVLSLKLPARLPYVVTMLLLAGWLAVQVAGLALYYRHPPHGNDGLRELAARLSRESQTGELVFVTPPALQPSLRQYFAGAIRGLPEDFDPRTVYLPYDPPKWNSEALAALEGGANGQRAFWLVYRPELDEEGSFLRAVQSRYRQTQVEQYEFGTLYRFEVRGPRWHVSGFAGLQVGTFEGSKVRRLRVLRRA